MNKYEFGRCKRCFGNNKVLKNGYCIDCEFDTTNKPKIVEDLLNMFDKDIK